jgi:hypothetical protein
MLTPPRTSYRYHAVYNQSAKLPATNENTIISHNQFRYTGWIFHRRRPVRRPGPRWEGNIRRDFLLLLHAREQRSLVKVKSSHYRPELAYRVGRGIALLFLDLGARRGWMASTTPRPLYPRERPGTHGTGGSVGLRAGLNVCEKSRPPPGFDPRTVQPVASRYTD